MASALVVGADVPVCLDTRPRIMRGVGEKLSPPLTLPAMRRCCQPGRAALDARGVRQIRRCAGRAELAEMPSASMR